MRSPSCTASSSRPARADPELGQGGLVGALPQRPRHGGRQLAGRRQDRRRAPDRVHDQRPRRARGQLLARRGRDGGEDAARLLRARSRHRRDADRAGVAPGLADDRLRRAAEQGGGRRERVRACSRHPPGWRAEGARHLRDHARRRRRLGGEQDRARQAVGPQRVQAAAAGPGHRDGVGSRDQRRLRALQGARRSQERHLRRGHRRARDGRGGDAPNTNTTGCSRCRSTPKPASARMPRSRSPPARSSITPKATATARSTPV